VAREVFVVTASGGGWAVERDGEFLMRTQQREHAMLLARSAAHRAFLNGGCSAVMVRTADLSLTTEWLFGFEDTLMR
jgi:hypothetical protein